MIFCNSDLKFTLFDLVLVIVKVVDKVGISKALVFLMPFNELGALGHSELLDKRFVYPYWWDKSYQSLLA